MQATIETVRGKIACKWALEDGRFVLDVSVPANTSAEIVLPDFVREAPYSGGAAFSEKDGKFRAYVCAGEYHIKAEAVG